MEDKLKKLILLMELKNEDKFSSFTESLKQLDKQGFELMSDIKLLSDELSNIDKKINDTELKNEIESLKESIKDIQLQKGDTGEKGDKGDTGEKGKDGLNGRDGIDGLDGLNGKDGENGKDGSPDTPEQIVEKINTLKNVIERKTIKGLDTVIDKPELDRAIDILDRRTQYLINKTVVQPNLSGYVPTTRTLTINGTAYDLSADRTWSVGTVTSVAALTLGTTGTDLSSSVATDTTTPVITLNVPTASATNRGALSSTDWTTFNAKESALTFSTGLTRTSNTITANLSTGIAGGQSVIGGTASGNNLTLSSTSNATKGKIIFGTSAYDEVNNRLGVGTTSPVARLDVSSPSGGVGTGIRLIQAANNVIQPYSYTSIDFTVPTTGLIGQFFATASNYSNPNVNLAANSIGLLSWDTNAQLLLGAVGSNGYISFDTGGYGYSNERMRILANGNVGIGTTTPGNLLSIVGNSSTPGGVAFNVKNSNVSGDTRFSLSSSNNRTLNVQVTGDSYVVNQKGAYLFTDGGLSNMTFMTDGDVGSGGSGYISFATGGYTLATQERMRITSTGNIGIGQTSPTARLMLPAGTATASTAPLKFTSGTNLTTAEAGAMEYNGSSLFFTRSGTLRAGLLMTDTASPFNTYSQSAKGATAFTSGTDNFLGGQLAGGALITGSQNVMIGTQAGNLANAGLINTVMIGYFAGQSASGTTIGSVFIGSQAGQIGVGSYNSNFIGQLAGFNASNAYHSNLFGYQAGYGISANNVNFFGQNAGYGATLANDTVGIGQNAGANATGSIESIYLGKNSGYNAVSTGITGDYNIGLGTNTLKAVTTGAGNIAIGYKVGDTITTGSKNIAIGYDIDYQSNTADGQLSIQNAIFGTGNTGTGTTASTGKIGIYTVAPTCALDVTGGIATSRTTVTAPATTDGNIFSGTYTPTLTGVTNITSSTAYVCQYMRVGNVVTVSGKLAITPTINNTQTTIGISLPIASNFANSQECGGSSHTVSNTTAGHGAAIYADATNDRAEMDYFETHGASDTFAFSFTYQII